MITPTATTALLSGAALWCMVWMAVEHVGEVPCVRDYVSTEQIKAWIKSHPTLAFLITEAINIVLHGVSSPVAMMFNAGGTCINLAVIYGLIPSENIFNFGLSKLKEAKTKFESEVKRGVASIKEAA